MSHRENHQNSVEKEQNPLKYFCSAITNLVKSANGNDKPSIWEKLSLDQLARCFIGVKKDKFLTEKPLAKALQTFQDCQGDIRDVIRPGVRITAVVNPCDINGQELGPKYFDDETNSIYPYFQLLYSNPKDPRGHALGMGNLRPAPLLHLYPEEILLQCSFVVDYDEPIDQANRTGSPLPIVGAGDDTSAQDYLYLADKLTEKYARLREIILGSLQ